MAKKCFKQDRHEEWGKDYSDCLYCDEKIGLTWREKVQEKAAKVPIEVRQKLIDLVRKGKTVGEAREECGIELHTATEISVQNISAHNYLNTEAV